MTQNQIMAERERVLARMASIPGVTPRPSMANFVLFDVEERERVYRYLVKSGVSVRDVSKYEELRSALRVTIGTPEENEDFLDALMSAMK